MVATLGMVLHRLENSVLGCLQVLEDSQMVRNMACRRRATQQHSIASRLRCPEFILVTRACSIIIEVIHWFASLLFVCLFLDIYFRVVFLQRLEFFFYCNFGYGTMKIDMLGFVYDK